jgi:hypothetical protein
MLAIALALTGCILDHEPIIIHEVYQVDPNCLRQDSSTVREDSTTWADSTETLHTTETQHRSCVVDLSDPRPPAAP